MQAKDTVSLKQIAGQNILVDLDQSQINFNKMITINETGVYIWKCLQKNISLEELQNKVAKHYKADVEVVAQDVEEFINKMVELHLIINE